MDRRNFSRNEALEIYVNSEGKIYDLEHKFVRYEVKNHPTEVTSSEKVNETVDSGY